MWKKFNLATSRLGSKDKPVQLVKIEGYLDSATFPRLQELLTSLVEQGNIRFLLDFKELDYISSAGLGILMGFLRQVRSAGGDLKVVHMSDKIERVFNLLGFSRLMKVYEDQEEALRAFEVGGPPPPEMQ